MIYLGIDDTDVVGTPGTNQLARAIARRLGAAAQGAIICRHQLLVDPRVPFTSKNGSASIQLPRPSREDVPGVIGEVRGAMRAYFIPGSDPGLCVAHAVSPEMAEFGRLCQRELVTRAQARAVASKAGVYLEGLGGSEQGVIGAIAAVGLIASGEDGRVVQLASWPYPDDFSGPRRTSEIRARGVEEIRCLETGAPVPDGIVDVGRHLRPNVRDGRLVLFVERTGESAWRAVKLP